VFFWRLMSFFVIQAARPALVARQMIPTMMAPIMPRMRRDLM
jgi:hypothetical protein